MSVYALISVFSYGVRRRGRAPIPPCFSFVLRERGKLFKTIYVNSIPNKFVQQEVDLPRQTIRSPNVLLDHPPQTTDSFTLYVKGDISLSILNQFSLFWLIIIIFSGHLTFKGTNVISLWAHTPSYFPFKAKNLNLRIRRRYPNTKDIRELSEFRELEEQALLFRSALAVFTLSRWPWLVCSVC